MNEYYSINSIKRHEPRIQYIKETLETMLSVVQLESGGQPIEVDGFRLRNLDNWVISNPFNDASVILTHCARQCSAQCSFCYLEGNPDDIALGQTRRAADIEEIETRLKYFEPEKGMALFNSAFEYRETLEYPHIKRVLTEIRQKTNEPFVITTNGAVLDNDMIGYLTTVKPLLLIVSIIVANYSIRKKVVGSFDDEVAINSIQNLCENNIPYVASITMWPDIPLEDLEATVQYCCDHNPYYIRIALPGVTRLQNQGIMPFNPDSYWREITGFIRSIRYKYDVQF